MTRGGHNSRNGKAVPGGAGAMAGVEQANGHYQAAPKAVVLGAGVAGLYAGRKLAAGGAKVTILERAQEVGGLASGERRGGNYMDLGVHHLHTFDREIFEDIQGLMGARLLPVPKVAKIRYGRGYRRYPLEFMDMLTGIPSLVLLRCMVGLGVQMAVNRLRPKEPRDAKEALIQLYGRPLYEHFFREFTASYWGLPPERLSATFVKRKMPRLSAVDVLKNALAKIGFRGASANAVESALRDETLYYSPTGSREMPRALADAVEAAGGEVHVERTVERVEWDESGVARVHCGSPGAGHPCDVVVSTIPLPAFVAALDPPPPADVLAAARTLRYKPIAVYGLLVKKDTVLDALYVYFRDRVFHRVAEPKRSGLEVNPPGHTLLLVEMTCEVGDACWQGSPEVVRQVIRDLEAEDLLVAADVVDVQLRRTEFGYPVFGLGFERDLETVTQFLARLPNLRSTGRQGGFCYPNMHAAMRMGADAAAEMLAYWEARGVGRLAEVGAVDFPGRYGTSTESRIAASSANAAPDGSRAASRAPVAGS